MFEKETTYRERRNRTGYPLILFGYHRGGHEFVKTFKELGKRYLVVDYDPNVFVTLEHQRIHYMYGDASYAELLEDINIDDTKLVISTFSVYVETEQLVRNVHRLNPEAVIICHAENRDEAIKLYELGSTYVMIPHYIGTEKISTFIRKSGLERSQFEHFREKHINYLMNHFQSSSDA
jgi:voltage-gated potassium channel Kch